MSRHLPLLVTALLLQACASAPPSVFDTPAPRRAVSIVPLDASPETQRAVVQARQRVKTAQKAAPRDAEGERLLQLAEQAAREGNNPRAQSLARQASSRADYAVETQRTREAAALLKNLYDTTGLSDAQLAQLRAAEAALVRGNQTVALKQLKALQTAAKAPRPYIVQRGDTLSAIAARESVYGNSLLWPLLWAANRSTLPDPNRLRAGSTLKIRPSPTVDEVVAAIQTARQYPSRVRIGRVKTLPKS